MLLILFFKFFNNGTESLGFKKFELKGSLMIEMKFYKLCFIEYKK